MEGVGGLFRVAQPFVPDLPPAVSKLVPIGVPVDPAPEDAYFNGASVPMVAWWFLRPMEPRVVAGSLVHDMLYLQRGVLADGDREVVVSRRFADLTFFVLMVRSQLEPWRAWVAFLAVRVYSRHLFRRCRAPRPPCADGLAAEHRLVLEAWSIVNRPVHRDSFARLWLVLAAMLLIGALGVGWAMGTGHELPTLVRWLTYLVGGTFVVISTSIPVISVWMLRQLEREASPSFEGPRA